MAYIWLFLVLFNNQSGLLIIIIIRVRQTMSVFKLNFGFTQPNNNHGKVIASDKLTFFYLMSVLNRIQEKGNLMKKAMIDSQLQNAGRNKQQIQVRYSTVCFVLDYSFPWPDLVFNYTTACTDWKFEVWSQVCLFLCGFLPGLHDRFISVTYMSTRWVVREKLRH